MGRILKMYVNNKKLGENKKTKNERKIFFLILEFGTRMGETKLYRSM
jgi:hypothetical protein